MTSLAVGLIAFGAAACGGSDGGTAATDAGATDGTTAPDDAGTPSDTTTTDDAISGAGPARLSADGTRIVDPDDETVLLRGVNLGAWLYNETWISGIDHGLAARAWVEADRAGYGDEAVAVIEELGWGGDDTWLTDFGAALAARIEGPDAETEAADVVAAVRACPSVRDDSDMPLYQVLEERFGVEGREALLDAYQDVWIREADIRALAAEGFNVVRVPIGYRALTRQSHLEPLTELVWNEATFDRIERLLDWCEDAGMWAVLDIQESPGGHNDYSGVATLYDDPAMQELTLSIWREMSRRFGDRDAVAAYSLLAEPFSAPSADARDEMYDQLVKAIRAEGDDHLLVIHDGFFGMNTLPDPAEYGWEGVVYSTHFFESAESVAGYELLFTVYDNQLPQAQERQGVPYFMGSFSTKENEGWAYEALRLMVAWMEGHGWSWSVWTVKKVDDPVREHVLGDAQTAWGLWGGPPADFTTPDLCHMSQEELAAAFAAYADLDLPLNREMLGGLLPDAPSAAE